MARTRDLTLRAVEELGIVRPRDVLKRGGHHGFLEISAGLGAIQRLGPGLYGSARGDFGPTARAAGRHPLAVVCLSSALWVHGLLWPEPESPFLAIGRSAWKPRCTHGVNFVRMREPALSTQIVECRIDGLPAAVYGPAKTIADCFKFEKLLPPSLPARAVLAALDQNRCSGNELLEMARSRRVLRTLRPVLECAERLIARPSSA